MHTTSVEVLEDVTQIALRDLTFDARGESAWDSLLGFDMMEIQAKMDDLAEHLIHPTYLPGQLVPRTYSSELSERTRLMNTVVSKAGANPGHVLNNLLYSHKVETLDPLPSAIAFGASRIPSWQLGVRRAVSYWQTLRPLVEAGIVVMDMRAGSAIVAGPPDWISIAKRLGRDRSFRSEILKIAPGLGANLDPWERELLEKIQYDFIGPESEAKGIAKARRRAFRLAVAEEDEPVFSSDLYAYFQDLNRFYRESSRSAGDLWLPSRSHLWLLKALSEADSPAPEVVDGLANGLLTLNEVGFPSTDGLSSADIVSIRLSDEVFEGWRAGVSAALDQFERTVQFGGDQATGRERAQDALSEASAKVLADIQRGKGKVWTAGAKGLVLGSLAVAPGVAVVGTSPTVWAAGAGLSLLGGLLWGRGENRSQHKAGAALSKHLAVLTASREDQ